MTHFAGLCLNIKPLGCEGCEGEQWSLPVASVEPITYILHGAVLAFAGKS